MQHLISSITLWSTNQAQVSSVLLLTDGEMQYYIYLVGDWWCVNLNVCLKICFLLLNGTSKMYTVTINVKKTKKNVIFVMKCEMLV